jgi:gamma-glutamyltranspeptidase
METDPISAEYHGIELWEHPPNGQGATAILLANILAQFDIAAMDPNGAKRMHIQAEATRLAYDARNRFIADPDQMARLDHMLDLDTARRLAALIDPAKATAKLTERRRGAQGHGLYHRRRQRPHVRLADLFDLPRVRFQYLHRQVRHHVAEPRRRLQPDARPRQ